MANNTIDLNIDIGEGFAHDIELLDYATSVNVACGWHAGDPAPPLYAPNGGRD